MIIPGQSKDVSDMDGKRFGKTIRLFLMDGISNGRIVCELSNWSGKAYKIPRGFVKVSLKLIVCNRIDQRLSNS